MVAVESTLEKALYVSVTRKHFSGDPTISSQSLRATNAWSSAAQAFSVSAATNPSRRPCQYIKSRTLGETSALNLYEQVAPHWLHTFATSSPRGGIFRSAASVKTTKVAPASPTDELNLMGTRSEALALRIN